jgi:RNA polymerase sigma-70 factor (ECF subfamily)
VDSGWECYIKARRGDKFAWQELVDVHRQRLMSLAVLITGSVADAEDIVQETFTRAIIAGARHYKGTLDKYLNTIAYRLSLKEKRHSRRKQPLTDLEAAGQDDSLMENFIKNERDCHIAKTIQGLDSKHREVLVLRFYGNYSYEEIAELTQTPLGTVKSRIFYAVKSCREILKKKGILE